MNSRIDDLIALAALGELTIDESAELDAAVAGDAAIARELADALDNAALLQSSPVEPPPALKASVMAAISNLPQDLASHDGTSLLRQDDDGSSPVRRIDPVAAATPTPASPNPASPNPASPNTVTPITATRDRRRRFAPLLAAAAVLALVVGGVVIATNSTGSDDEDPIAAVVDADDAVTQSVTGSMGDLELFYSPGEEAFVLVGDSVELLPADSTYQVWLVNTGDPTSLGTFEPDGDGSMGMRADGVDPTGSTIAITVEPAGGSPQPTSPPVAQTSV